MHRAKVGFRGASLPEISKNLTENWQKSIKSGAIWTTVAQIIAGLCQWAQLFWLARMLPPADFGLMAIAQTAVGFLAPMTDLGLSQAIIQQKTLEKRQLNTLFWLNLAIGLAFFFLFFGVGWGSARYFSQPILQPMMLVVASVFLLFPLAAQPSAMLLKNLDFRSVAIIEVISWAFSLIFAVFLAKNGFGVFALAWAHVAKYTSSLVASWWLARKICPIPTLEMDWKSSRTLVRFGLFHSGSNWLNYVHSNIDKIIVGKWLGMTELGIYNLAWNLMLVPLSRVVPIISRLAMPIFSKIQQEKESILSEIYFRAVRINWLVCLPIFIAISLISNDLIILFFGDVWLPTAPVLSILAFAGLLRSTGAVGATVLLARGRPEPGLWWNFGFGVFICGWMVVWLHFSPTAISAAWAQLTGVFATFWIWHLLISRVGKIDYWPIIQLFLTSAVYFGGLFFVVFLVKNSHFHSNFSDFIFLFVFLFFYFFYLKISGFWLEIFNFIKR